MECPLFRENMTPIPSMRVMINNTSQVCGEIPLRAIFTRGIAEPPLKFSFTRKSIFSHFMKLKLNSINIIIRYLKFRNIFHYKWNILQDIYHLMKFRKFTWFYFSIYIIISFYLQNNLLFSKNIIIRKKNKNLWIKILMILKYKNKYNKCNK